MFGWIFRWKNGDCHDKEIAFIQHVINSAIEESDKLLLNVKQCKSLCDANVECASILFQTSVLAK
jgi:hypothetical protein